jgi:hypothetical protein
MAPSQGAATVTTTTPPEVAAATAAPPPPEPTDDVATYDVDGFDAWRPGARDLARQSIAAIQEQTPHCRSEWLAQEPYATSATADVVITLDTRGTHSLVSAVSFPDSTDRAVLPCFDGLLQGAEVDVPPGADATVRLRFRLAVTAQGQ